MAATLQPVLSCGEGAASDVSVFLSSGGTTYDVYVGVSLFERVGADPEIIQHKMLVGRLFNAGVPVGELAAAFSHDPRTIRKWGLAVLSGDIDEMARVFAGRGGPPKVVPELIRYARQLYRRRAKLGRNYRAAIIDMIEEVFCVRISTATASGIFRAEAEKEAREKPEIEAIALQDDAVPASKPSSSVKWSPTPLPAQCVEGGGGRQLIHHAGQALFAGEMKAFADPLQRQFLGQILQGAVNVEQSKTLCGHSLANFTGPILAGLKEQRDALDAQARPEGVLEVYRRNSELLADGPNRGEVFYFDPHTKEYTGQLKVLKGWCGSRHAIRRIVNLDAFHTRSGRPCFIAHHSPYHDMRERFFMNLARFDLLFDEDRRRGRTFVVDRGIYGLAALQAFEHDHVVTWEKGYRGGGWKEDRTVVAFERSLTRNSSRDRRTVRFQCQQSPWRRDRRFRRILVRASRDDRDPIEVSVLTSNPDMDVQDVVWAIFRRWLQENDFKYLDSHFGINQLTSRDSASFREQVDQFEDRPVDSPEYRELKAALRTREADLGKRLVALRRHERTARELEVRKAKLKSRRPKLRERMERILHCEKDDLPPPRGTARTRQQVKELALGLAEVGRKQRANESARLKVQARATRVEDEIEPLEARLCEAVRKQSRLHLLVEEDYRLLDTRKKAMMDALRVAASNIFRNVQQKFRAICDNHRDDHVLLRMLSRCDGTMERTGPHVVFRLWVTGTLQPHRTRHLETLLRQVQEQTNAEITGVTPIRLELMSGPLALQNRPE